MGKLDIRARDLARQPVLGNELAPFDVVVLDPPHAGAAAQMPHIARAKVPTVIYVSCDPAALGRDARVLRDAGYRLERVTPIDQFLWSARLEAVAVFRLGH
jgi:23S rRNA (uracil1939-C5)-methyltransferase